MFTRLSTTIKIPKEVVLLEGVHEVRYPALPKELLGWNLYSNEDPIATKTFIVQQGFFTAVELFYCSRAPPALQYIVILQLSLRASITHRLFEV